jgi:hypothetical protein
LKNKDFTDLSLDEQVEFVGNVLDRLGKYAQMELATETATGLWKERIDFQIQFFQRLQAQLERGSDPKWRR